MGRAGKAAGLMATASLPHPGQDGRAARIEAEAAGPLGAAAGKPPARAGRVYRRQVEEFVARSRREVADMRSRLAHALREAEQLRVDLAAARRAAWETAGQGERMARELTALRTQAQMALARNLWWPPPQPDGE